MSELVATAPLVPRCKQAWQTAELSPGNLHHCDIAEHHDGAHRCVCGVEIDVETP